MKRAGSMLVLCAMLILSLTACGSKPANTKRAIMNEGKQMMLDAKYYAAPNGRVRGMGKAANDMRSATDKAADDIRKAGDTMGNALQDMTRK